MRHVQENTYSRSLKGNWRTFLALSVILDFAILDGLAKIYALQHLPSEQAVKLQPVLSFAVHKNPGILFDIPLPLAIIAPLTIVALAVLGSMAWKARFTQPAIVISAFAAFTGALNNLIDRIINGFTTDYLILFRTSAINLSDVLILLGIFCLLWYGRHNSPKALSEGLQK